MGAASKLTHESESKLCCRCIQGLGGEAAVACRHPWAGMSCSHTLLKSAAVHRLRMPRRDERLAVCAWIDSALGAGAPPNPR